MAGQWLDRSYSEIDSLKKWELLYEDIILVLLGTGVS
jgi:hypothetical protein